MTLWRAGPLVLDVSGRIAPPDWFSEVAPSRGGPNAITISFEAGDVGTSTDGVAHVVGTENSARLTRGGSWRAEVDFARGHATYRGGYDVDGARQCPTFESFLRVLASELLLRTGGALLHASSVAINGRGYVFCGLSGAGKTTLVEGTPDGEYLTDDQSIVTTEFTESGAYRVLTWGTPFSGSAARRAPPLSASVQAIVLLSSERPAVTRLERATRSARTAAELLRHLCAHDRSAAAAARALGVVEALVTRVPVIRLERHMSTSLREIVQAIDALVAANAGERNQNRVAA